MKTVKYVPVPKHPGIFRHTSTGRYQARIAINGKQSKESFDTLFDARVWRSTFDGEKSAIKKGVTATLGEVWEKMQKEHFPILAISTQQIWKRRFTLLEDFYNFRMEEITSSEFTEWVTKKVSFFRSEEYTDGSRGEAKRCNLDNELNLFVTIFNWYKQHKDYEAEAVNLVNPVRLSHKRLGFIRAKPVKNKSITLDAALQFFSCLKPLYRDLALFQYFTASRISEAAGLQWKRVDFDNRTITIMETCRWGMDSKLYEGLNEFPKNREPRTAYMTDELMSVLKRRLPFKVDDCGFVFHVEGRPLDYSNIQVHYRSGQRVSRIPYTGTHILRHGMAKLARQVGGGLDAVIAMTGHKDFKLADHYSKLDNEFQKEVSEKIMQKVNMERMGADGNVVEIAKFAKSK